MLLNVVFIILILFSVISAVITGNTEKFTEAVLNEPVNAVELCIYLCGGMCFWGGLMRVADKSGVTERIASVLSLLIGWLFKGLDKKGKAFRAICMNLTANLMGLGNAATPVGIEAMKAIAEEENAQGEATPSMVTFTVMNTASLTLIPSTAISLRMKYGSADPMEIIPGVWAVSAAALAAALIIARLPYIGKGGEKNNKPSDSIHNSSHNNHSGIQKGRCVR